MNYLIVVVQLGILVHINADYDLKCPTAGQWRLRAQSYCPHAEMYTCLYYIDPDEQKYIETCTGPRRESPGEKPVINSGNFDNVDCSEDRYQPILFSTTKGSNCLYLKSNCNEEGQFIYSNGSTTQDRTCGCNYVEQYVFLSLNISHPCYCIPSVEDCTCYKKACDSGFRLSPDYKCVPENGTSGSYNCKEIVTLEKDKVVNLTKIGFEEEKLEGKNRDLAIIYTLPLLVLVLFGVLWMVFCGWWIYDRYILCTTKVPFTSLLSDIDVVEGDNIVLSCVVCMADVPMKWFIGESGDTEITDDSDPRYKISADGKIHELTITEAQCDDGDIYTVQFKNRKCSARVNIHVPFTSLLSDIDVVEDDNIVLRCVVCMADVPVKWFRGESGDTEITDDSVPRYKISADGTNHTLTITEAQCDDGGIYTVQFKDRKCSARVNIHVPFTLLLSDIDVVEDDNIVLSCIVCMADVPVKWFRGESGDTEITDDSDPRYKISADGTSHKLTITEAQCDDGDIYTVQFKDRKCSARVNMHEIPVHLKELSEKDKKLYMDILKSKTELRHYIRILILGKKAVGKTSLLRRLLEEDLEGVESTDGIDVVVGRCRIRRSDGKWFFDKVTDSKQVLLARIKSALNEKTPVEEISEFSEQSGLVVGNPIGENVTSSKPKTIETTYLENAEKHSHGIANAEKHSHGIENADKHSHDIENADKHSHDIEHADKHSHDIENADKHSQPNVSRIAVESNNSSPADFGPQERISNAISGKVIEALDDILTGINTVELDLDQFVECGFWDFAGEKDYYATHQIFLHSHALYVLVEDINQPIKPFKTGVKFNSIGGYMDFWFNNIHCHSVSMTNEDKLDPPVIVVGTGTDKCKEKLKDQKDTFRRQLLSVLGNEEQKHLRHLCFVSNTEPKDKEFDELRSAILEHGKYLQTYSERLPLRWIQLERSLDVISDAGVNILSRHDVTKLSLKCGISDENEILLFLNYQHKIGSLIFFEAIPKYIILKHTWLANAFKCLVCDDKKIDSNVKLTAQWKKLEDTGELEETLIKMLFEKEPEFKSDAYQVHILEIMEEFDTIVKPTTTLVGGQISYYMPCMIYDHTSLDDIFEVFGVGENDCVQTPWLCIDFRFMPFSFFNHILCHYIRKYIMCKKPSTSQLAIYHSMAVFFLDDTKFSKLLVCFFKNTVAIQIWHWRKIKSGVCKAILLDLKALIEKLKMKYEAKQIDYVVKAKCANGNIQCPSGRISFADLPAFEGDEYFCEEHNKGHQSNQMYQTWYEDFYEDKEMTSNTDTNRDIQEVKTDYATMKKETFEETQRNIQEVKTDYATMKMETFPETQRDTESFDSVRCQLCVSDPRPAVYWCNECLKAMCRECTTVHRTQPTSSTHTTVLLTRDYNFQIKGILIFDIASLCEGVLIISDRKGKQLISCDIKGHNKQLIPLPYSPYRLSVIDQNNVAVTAYDDKKVLIVDVTQKNITKQFDIKKECSGIMYRDNHLYLSCYKSLVKVDMSGEIIRTVPLSFTPWCICSGTEGRIYCTDLGIYTVYCIDTEGNTVFTVNNPDMSGTTGITTDNEGHVLVVCGGSNNVHRISPDGKQCYVIIKDIPSNNLRFPSICYDSISKSIVISRDDTVYVYKI